MIETQVLTERIKEQARALGFDLVGVASVEPSAHASFYREWLTAERHGEMGYLARKDAVQRRLEAPAGLRSALVVGLNYFAAESEDQSAERAIIARHARGRDYHKVIKNKLLALLTGSSRKWGTNFRLRARAWTPRPCWSVSWRSARVSAGSAGTQC
jgi:epoxyqueuosine reductase